MPASHEIDPSRRLVISRAWGVLTAAEVAEHYRAIAADPAFDPSFSQLADLSRVEHVDMSSPSVRREALETVFSSRSLRAFVARTDEQAIVAKLYGLFGRYVRQNIRVFPDVREAERWLGLSRADEPQPEGPGHPEEPGQPEERA
jgi:hypothetical protein